MHSCRAKFSAADDFHSDRLEENFVRGACLVMFVPYRWSTCCLPPPFGPVSTVWTRRMGTGSPMLRRFGDRDGEEKRGLAAETGSTSRSRLQK